MKKNNISQVNICYFGTMPLEYYGMSYLPLDPKKKMKGFCAISTTYRQGGFLINKNDFKWLNDFKPFDTIGYSIFLYNIP